MAVDIVMPQMGESIFEGTITKWLKKPGDKVERDEPLFEISTDKVDAEIPSPSAGVLKEIKVGEGQTVPIQTIVGVIDAAGSAAAAPAPVKTAAPPPAPAKAPVAAAPVPAPPRPAAPVPAAAPIAAAPASSGSTGSRSSRDRKSTRLNSSHGYISYAVFCLKKKGRSLSTRRLESSFLTWFSSFCAFRRVRSRSSIGDGVITAVVVSTFCFLSLVPDRRRVGR